MIGKGSSVITSITDFPTPRSKSRPSPPTSEPNREDVTYTIQEGERFTVNRVMVAGTEHTRDYVVQREIQVHEGEPLSQQGPSQTPRPGFTIWASSARWIRRCRIPRAPIRRRMCWCRCRRRSATPSPTDGGLEFQTGQPAGTTAPQGTTGVSPRVEFDVTRLNVRRAQSDADVPVPRRTPATTRAGQLRDPEVVRQRQVQADLHHFLRQQPGRVDVHLAATGREDRPAAADLGIREPSRERVRDPVRSPIASISGG